PAGLAPEDRTSRLSALAMVRQYRDQVGNSVENSAPSAEPPSDRAAGLISAVTFSPGWLPSSERSELIASVASIQWRIARLSSADRIAFSSGTGNFAIARWGARPGSLR